MALEWECDKEYCRKNEDELHAQFSAFLIGTNLFNVYHEVDGKYTHRHPNKEEKEPRIDYILTPKAKLANLGWPFGAIGLELKLEKKATKGISQILDYMKGVFILEPINCWVMPSIIAIAPYSASREVCSILAQNGCATATIKGGKFKIRNGGTTLLSVTGNGDVVTIREMQSGKKVGSR